MEKKIFLSVGRTFTRQQEDFVAEFEGFLERQGLTPQTVGRTYFSSQQPLKAIDELMRQCCGSVILAFERTHVNEGIDKRGSPDEKPLQDMALPTVWNQIEAAMAYTIGHPILVIVEHGLKSEGLLEVGYDWYVNWMELSVSSLRERQFVGVFEDWKRRVNAYAARMSPGSTPAAAATLSTPVQPQEEPARAVQVKPADGKIRILFLTANPTDSNRLRLDEESRAIDQALRRAEFRDKFELNQFQAVRVTDLQDCLLRFEPHIVHFSGHGTDSGELLLQDGHGVSQPVSERSLSTLFSVLKDNIRCVILNACYSERQAEAIVQHIDCVVGMSNAIDDEAAIGFSASFYQALAYGRDIATAFELGCVQIDLESLGEQDVPVLLAEAVDPHEIQFVL